MRPAFLKISFAVGVHNRGRVAGPDVAPEAPLLILYGT